MIWHAVDTFYMSKQNPLPNLLVEPIPINDVMGYTDTDNSQLLSQSVKAQKQKKTGRPTRKVNTNCKENLLGGSGRKNNQSIKN